MSSTSINFSVVICTYRRPEALSNLLGCLIFQTAIPLEIIIVDASEDDFSFQIIHKNKFLLPLCYFHSGAEHKGLTKQRNLGVSKVSSKSEIVFFLDDDVIPEKDFFEKMLESFSNPEVVGCAGLITNENDWKRITDKIPEKAAVLDDYYLDLSKRDRIRAKLGLYPYRIQPGRIPLYGHGKDSLPPTGIMYEVDHIMGGITAYRKTIFSQLTFSTFFEGYGLYEDFDFSVRASAYGKLISHSGARVSHHHAVGGRPDTYRFGKMVIRNGWYVWRLKYPSPSILNQFKWHIITLLLMMLRATNVITSDKKIRREAFRDALGRFVGWCQLFIEKPEISK